jgi:gliding motility-associated-like protein
MTTASNCVTVDTQQVKLFDYMEIFVPSAFTPNNDGKNDFVYPIAAGFKKLMYFKIFNRWGQQVFDITQNEQGWDGIYKGVPQPVNTYIWMAEGIGIDNKSYRKKGTIVLIR